MAETNQAASKAAQPAPTQALSELTPATSSIGVWLVKVHRDAQIVPYSYTWEGKTKDTKKVEVLLIGQDAETYCIGRARKTSSDDRAMQALADKFKAGTIWKMSRVALLTENRSHLGCTVKVVVDLARTTWAPVLQSTVPMPSEPAPVELLSDIVSVKAPQRCDVICLLQNVAADPKPRNTAHGERKVVEVAICDGSKDGGELAKVSLTLWFPASSHGLTQVERLTEAWKAQEPVALFGLYVSPEGDKVSCKTAKDFWWMACSAGAQSSAKCQKLRAEAKEILQDRQMKELAVQDDWSPQEKADYTSCPATRVNVQLLQTILQRERAALPQYHAGGYVLFQLNCVRLVEPNAGETVYTKDGSRLFVPVRIMDDWGQMTLRMREEAALLASGCGSSADFASAVASGALKFPILSSVRVRVRRSATSPEDNMDAIVVEAEEQNIAAACRPNASLLGVAEVSRPLGSAGAGMLVGALSEITRAPHAGLSVRGTGCDFALTLCAVKGNSDMQPIGEGYRIVTGGLFEVRTSCSEASSQLSETAHPGRFVSMCTLGNLTQYTLTPSRPGGLTYVVALISNVLTAAQGSASEPLQTTFIVDRVSQPLQADDRLDYALLLNELEKFSKLAKPHDSLDTSCSKRRAEWAQEAATTLSSAKKAKALSREPTNTPLPDSSQ